MTNNPHRDAPQLIDFSSRPIRSPWHRDALEAFNRASHSDALREMQLTGLAESCPCEASYRYSDPIRPTPASVIGSMETRDLFVSIATATLLVIVIPLGLLVLMAL